MKIIEQKIITVYYRKIDNSLGKYTVDIDPSESDRHKAAISDVEAALYSEKEVYNKPVLALLVRAKAEDIFPFAGG